VYFIDGAARQLEISKPLVARAKYTVTVKALQSSSTSSYVTSYVSVSQQSKEFLAGQYGILKAAD
jgi:hypothetical protein